MKALAKSPTAGSWLLALGSFKLIDFQTFKLSTFMLKTNPPSQIILASSSPRRCLLLTQVGVDFMQLIPAAVEETPLDLNFADVVQRNAAAKARTVLAQAQGRLILSADTIVELDGKPLGKPRDRDDAHRMLRALSGREHRVYSGIALIKPTGGTLTDYARTVVQFRGLSDEEITDYIASGEPMDKAGSYGIQARGALFIESVSGCFFNVMGLPLAKLWRLLHRAGWRMSPQQNARSLNATL